MREYKFKMSAFGAEIFLYEEVYSYGVASLVKQIAALGNDAKITLRINSPGGDIYAGIALYNALLRRRDNVTVIIDGLAASAASYIAMASSRIVMPANAYMMVHNPFAYMVGDADDMAAYAEVLRKLTHSICRGYAARTGLTDEAVAALLDAETWLTAEEAVAAGFADEVEAEVLMAASASMARVVSRSYARAPSVLMQALGPSDGAGDPDPDADPAPVGQGDEVEEASDPADDAGAAASDDGLTQEQRHAIEISETCALAGRPEMIAGFLRDKATPAQVRAALMSAPGASGWRGARVAPQPIDYGAIAEMCLLVGRPEAAAGYIKAGASLDAVRADLLAQRANAAGGDIDPTHTGVQTPHSAKARREMDGDPSRINARKIIAGHNARASKWRR